MTLLSAVLWIALGALLLTVDELRTFGSLFVFIGISLIGLSVLAHARRDR